MTYAALNPTLNKTNLHHGEETFTFVKKEKKGEKKEKRKKGI